MSGSGARAEQDGDQPLEEARRQEAFILGGQRTASRGALVIHPLTRSVREPRGCDDYGQISILTRLVGAKLSPQGPWMLLEWICQFPYVGTLRSPGQVTGWREWDPGTQGAAGERGTFARVLLPVLPFLVPSACPAPSPREAFHRESRPSPQRPSSFL